eukprot:SAG11_NODE_1408_length_4998_cov_19.780772_3_plen_69_part_00
MFLSVQHKDLHMHSDEIRSLVNALSRNYEDVVSYDGAPYIDQFRDSDRSTVITKIDRCMTSLGNEEFT